jgi:hypothetical protein
MSFFHAPIESRLLKKVKGLSLTFGTAPSFICKKPHWRINDYQDNINLKN